MFTKFETDFNKLIKFYAVVSGGFYKNCSNKYVHVCLNKAKYTRNI